MRFTNGVWFDREGHAIYNAVEVGDLTVTDDSIRALCTIRHVRDRGDTLNKPTITISLSSPCPGIVAGTATHFKGAKSREPRFELFPDVKPQPFKAAAVADKDGKATLESGDLKVTLNTSPSAFNLAYSTGDEELTNIGWSCMQYIVAPDDSRSPYPPTASTTIADPYYRAPASTTNKPYMAVSLGLQPGEYVYGLGERFGPLIKNGQSIDLWNEDAGTCTPYTYKNVPFYWTSKGYGVFFDHTSLVSLEVQTERLARVQASVQGEQIRWYVIHGPTPKDVLARYTMLTGRAPLPPAWSFGLYLSTSFLTDYSEQVVTSQLDGMRDRKIPFSVLHFDCFWMKQHSWTNFTFDEEYFPDPKGFLQRVHDRGLKVCVWMNPYIAQESCVFDEAAEKGYLIRRNNGDIFQSEAWQAGMAYVDFTNPEAVQWYTKNLQDLIDLGVDSFKTDFGERIPWEDVQYHNGMDPYAGHNYYSIMYNRTVYNAIVEKRGANEAALFARSASAGGQRFPVHWGGDCECTWNGMAQSLRGGLSLGMSGFGFYSHDIGGFMSEGQAATQTDAAIYKRWVQFGLLSSHSRLHGSKTSRAPWTIDEEACEVVKKFCELKNMLMPYIFAQSIDAKEKGLPLMRAMVIEFPDDKVCHTLDQQYMLGDSLLVAPVFNTKGYCEYYVPAGTWTGLLDGKLRKGPGYHRETFDNFHLPLLVRENTVLAIGQKERPDYDWETSIERLIVGSYTEPELKVRIPSFSKHGEFAAILNIDACAGNVMVNGAHKQSPVLRLSEEVHL